MRTTRFWFAPILVMFGLASCGDSTSLALVPQVEDPPKAYLCRELVTYPYRDCNNPTQEISLDSVPWLIPFRFDITVNWSDFTHFVLIVDGQCPSNFGSEVGFCPSKTAYVPLRDKALISLAILLAAEDSIQIVAKPSNSTAGRVYWGRTWERTWQAPNDTIPEGPRTLVYSSLQILDIIPVRR